MAMLKAMSGSKKSKKKVKMFKNYQKKDNGKSMRHMFDNSIYDKSRLPKFLKEAM